MSGLTLVYATAIGVLLSGAAMLLERAQRDRRRPARALWLVTMAATLSAPWWGPALARLSPGSAAGSAPATFVAQPGTQDDGLASIQLLAGLREVRNAAAAVGRRLGESRAEVARMWGVAATGALVLVLITLVRLHRRVSSWPRARVGGDPVVVSPELGPACVGLLHARVVLPRWALRLPRGELDLVMRHERAHADAADPLLLAAGLSLAAAAPWNPLLWWQLTRLRRATELDCDARVLESGADAASYGRTLVNLVRRSRPAGLAAAALVEPPSFLERRLTLMRTDTPPRRTVTLAAVAGAALLVTLACETPPPTELQDADSGPATFSAGEVSVMEPSELTLVVDGVIVRDWALVDGMPAFDGFDPATIRSIEISRVSPGRTIEILTGDDPEGGAITQRIQALREAFGKLRPSKEIEERPGARATFRVREIGPEAAKAAPGTPLIVVDGVISDIPLEQLNTLDIQAIEVVKGKAALTLHGERASGGVIQVTTKDGGGEVR